jgi:hypothetical protein
MNNIFMLLREVNFFPEGLLNGSKYIGSTITSKTTFATVPNTVS